MGCIYGIENLVNGKWYVGQTILAPDFGRIRHHFKLYPGSPLIQSAIRKYGAKNFDWCILDDGILIQEVLDDRECYWIRCKQSMVPYGYNLREGGYGGAMAQSTKDKMSAAQKVRFANPLARQKLSTSQKRRYLDTDERQKTSMANKRRYLNPNERQKTSSANKRYWSDPLVRQNWSNVQRLRYLDPVARQKSSMAQKKRFEDPIERKKMSDAQKRRYSDPVQRQKTSEAMRRARRLREASIYLSLFD